MTGRHAQNRRRGRRWPLRLAGALVIGALLGGAGYVARDYLRDDRDPPAAEEEQACPDPVTAAVAAAPDIAPVLGELADAFTAEEDEAGRCVAIDVSAAPSVQVASQLGASQADLWVPDSSVWLQRASGGEVTLGEPRPIAISPLVTVASKQVAQEMLGWPDAEFSWGDVVGGAVPAAIADPMTTSEGLATLLAVQGVVGGAEADRARVVEAMTAVSRTAVDDVGETYSQLEGDPLAAPLFTASEQSVVAHNRENPDKVAVALYPEEGTLAFDYPAVPMSRPGTDPATEELVERFVETLHADPAVAALRDAGFRSSDGTARESAGVTDGIQPQMPELMPAPDAETAGAVLRQWAALSLDMRMLAVIDVSGSMWFSDEDDERTRIEIVRDANLAALQLLPPTSDLGLWVFSTDEDPPNHWREEVSLGPLTEEYDDGTRLDALIEASEALPDSEVQGWTALYDTAWAAYREVKENYDPNRVNSVVLMTDGSDERDPDMEPGMDLETLLAQLQAQHDSARPVVIITIGVGPDADMDALEQISAATGASSYQAVDPADLPEIFFQAMVERQCRPDC